MLAGAPPARLGIAPADAHGSRLRLLDPPSKRATSPAGSRLPGACEHLILPRIASSISQQRVGERVAAHRDEVAAVMGSKSGYRAPRRETLAVGEDNNVVARGRSGSLRAAMSVRLHPGLAEDRAITARSGAFRSPALKVTTLRRAGEGLGFTHLQRSRAWTRRPTSVINPRLPLA